jgi:hypothetical protein
MNYYRLTILCLALLFNESLTAQFIDTSPDRVKTPLKVEMKRIGTIKPAALKKLNRPD